MKSFVIFYFLPWFPERKLHMYEAHKNERLTHSLYYFFPAPEPTGPDPETRLEIC